MGQTTSSGDALRRHLLGSASETQRRRLVVLSGLTPEPGVNARLIACGRAVDRHGRRSRCNRPLCPSCGERMRNRRTRRQTLETCETAASQGYTVAHLTVALRPTADLEELGSIFRAAKRAMAGCRQRLRRQNPRGLSVAGEGQLEIGLVPDDQLSHVGEGRRRTLAELGFPEGAWGGPGWCPHLHVLMLIPPCTSVDDVGGELRRVFTAWRQVHVEPIPMGAGFVRSVFRVARYGSKFRGVTEVAGAAQRNWSREEVALLLDWTARHSPRGRRGVSVAFGMADLRRNIGAKGRG